MTDEEAPTKKKKKAKNPIHKMQKILGIKKKKNKEELEHLGGEAEDPP